VREIAPGERVDARGAVVHANGEREALSPCRFPRLDLHTRRPIVPRRGVTPEVNGWVEASNWIAGSPLGSLSAGFPVPPAPPSNGATIFFFPGSEPDDGSTILQPVLQYGTSAAGGGSSWTAASWFCCPAGWSSHSSPIDVKAGDTILATMTASCFGSSCNWSIVTADSTIGTSSALPADNVASPFVWNFGGVLESYAVTSCAQYPAGGTTTFSNITLRDQNGNPMLPDWTLLMNGGTPSCNYSVTMTEVTTSLTY
jgi:hypothetical protein